MPPEKQYQAISVALAMPDKVSLAKLANELGKTKGEVARDAIKWYMENYNTISKNEKEDGLTRVILKCTDRIIAVNQSSTNRICSLLVRVLIDTNMTMMMLFRMLPPEQSDQIMTKLHRMAVSRVVRKVPPEELNIVNMIRAGLAQQTLDEQLPKAS